MEGQEDRAGTFSGVVFNCDDLAQPYAELQAKGVEFHGPPETQPWGSYVLFNDSESNTFCLSSSRG